MGTHPIFESDFDCLTDILIEWERDWKLSMPVSRKPGRKRCTKRCEFWDTKFATRKKPFIDIMTRGTTSETGKSPGKKFEGYLGKIMHGIIAPLVICQCVECGTFSRTNSPPQKVPLWKKNIRHNRSVDEDRREYIQWGEILTKK